jgi:hypothetical protein
MSEDNPKPKKTGCAILFVPALIVIDLVGMATSYAGRYAAVVNIAGLVGFGVGAALGAYLSAKTKESTSYSLSFWLVAGGLIGMLIPALIAITMLPNWLIHHPH